MARERRITCGDHGFTTRANPRVFVRCPTCRTGHRAPPIADGWAGPDGKGGTSADDASHDVAGAVADLAAEVLPPPASTAIKITRATHSTARAAKRAAKATTSGRPTAKRGSAKSPTSTKSQAAGRRGGRSSSSSRPAFLRRVGR